MKHHVAWSLCSLLMLAGLSVVGLALVGMSMLAESAERPDPGAIPGWDGAPMWNAWHPDTGAIGVFAMTLIAVIFVGLAISLIRALTYHKH